MWRWAPAVTWTAVAVACGRTPPLAGDDDGGAGDTATTDRSPADDEEEAEVDDEGDVDADADATTDAPPPGVWSDETVHGLGYDVALDSQDDAVVVGVEFTNSGQRAWIRKYGRDGSVRWTAMPFELTSVAYGVAVDASDRIWIAAELDGDVLIARFLADGTLDATTTLDGPAGGTDIAYAIDDAPDGGVFVAGTVAIDPATYDDDIWIARFADSFELEWHRTVLPTPKTDGAWSIAATADGGAAIAGFLDAELDNRDVVVARLDAFGNVLWTATRNGAGLSRDEGLAVVVEPGGDLIAAGYVQTENDYAAWLARYGDGGDVQWEVTQAPRSFLHGLALAPPGILAVGSADDGDEDAIWRTAWVDGGGLAWTWLGADVRGDGNAIAVADDGYTVVVGSTYENTQMIWVRGDYGP
jgi:hypothetical protein